MKRARTYPIPRQAHLDEWCRAWETLPALGRLMMLDVQRQSFAVSAIETRLVACQQTHEHWGDDCDPEPAVAVCVFSQWFTPAVLRSRCAIKPSTYERMQEIRASISHHALGRCFQRWQNTEWRKSFKPATDTDVLAAMIPLAYARTNDELLAMADTNGRFAIPAAAGLGSWHGELVRDPNGKGVMLSCRTFLRSLED
jgi:hypothetical protein